MEDEWVDERKREIWKSRIRLAVGKIENRIYARKCEVKEISSQQAREFFEENHLEGYVNSSVKLGLFYNRELVAAMAFGKSRFHKSEYELTRFAVKKNTVLVGGASKLLSYFRIQYARKLGIKKIVSYSSDMYSDGGIYRKLGFKYISTSIGYWWAKGPKRYNRINFQKHKLKDIFDDVTDKTLKTSTEDEIMRTHIYLKIYDGGQSRWELEL